VGLENTQFHLIRTLDDALAFKNWLGERRDGYLAVDTETSGLDCLAPDARIRLVQIGDARVGWAIPWDTWKGLTLEALNSWEGDFVYHNCFAGDERYITSDGYKSFAETVGTLQEVWDGDSWVKAEIMSFGRQPVQRVSFMPKGRNTKVLRDVVVTPDHRWVLANRRYETTDLRVGDVVAMDVPKCLGRRRPKDSDTGWCSPTGHCCTRAAVVSATGKCGTRCGSAATRLLTWNCSPMPLTADGPIQNPRMGTRRSI
jgi:hypothetical protein